MSDGTRRQEARCARRQGTDHFQHLDICAAPPRVVQDENVFISLSKVAALLDRGILPGYLKNQPYSDSMIPYACEEIACHFALPSHDLNKWHSLALYGVASKMHCHRRIHSFETHALAATTAVFTHQIIKRDLQNVGRPGKFFES
eukprot:scaffold2917_cov191-Amphora_coffeaeformis.AAC.5